MIAKHDFEPTQYIVGYKDGYVAITYENSSVYELYVIREDGESCDPFYFQGLRLEFCGSETRDQWVSR